MTDIPHIGVDSLNIGTGPIGPTDTIAHTSTEALQEVFGGEARFVPSEVVNGIVDAFNGTPLTDNWVVRVVALILFVGYVATMLLYGGHIVGMWKIVVGRNLGIKVADELSYLFVRAMLSFCGIGIVALALSAVKALEILGVEQIEGVESLWMAPMVMLAIVGAMGVIQLLTEAMCRLVRRVEVAQGLSIMGSATIGLMAVVVAPCTLLFVINDGLSAQIVGITIAVVVCLGVMAYVVKSFIFFVEQKISILLWFLYLCTVVLIPLGVVVTTLVRNSSI
ncbi:MAG: DUF4271 domain-containing protein [Tidjanibacter sp.]|nr:DUF4271 domain-containing protein [Tidjanibacter sp.]